MLTGADLVDVEVTDALHENNFVALLENLFLLHLKVSLKRYSVFKVYLLVL